MNKKCNFLQRIKNTCPGFEPGTPGCPRFENSLRKFNYRKIDHFDNKIKGEND